jgi:MFS family permease
MRRALASGWYAENRVLVWMCVLIACNQLGFGSIVPVVPLYASSFHVPASAIGLTIAIYGLARFLINVPAGQLADRCGRRVALTIGSFVTVAGNLLCALAPAYLPFVGARFVAGAGAALVLTAAQIVLADISTPARRGRIMATYSGVFAFAVGAGPFPGGLLADRFGLAAPFYAFAALGSLVAVVAWFRVPETKGWRDGGAVVAALPPFRAQVPLLAARPGFLPVCLITFSAAFARTGALFNLIPVLAQHRLGLGPDRIGLGLGLISVMGIALAYPSGAAVDRFGRKTVIVPATALTGVALVLFALAPSYRWFLAACAVWSVASGISSDAPGAYAADSAPPGMNAAAMSTYRMLADFGYVVGPLLLGLVADTAGANVALAGTAIGLMIVALLFARLAPETYRACKHLFARKAAAEGEPS